MEDYIPEPHVLVGVGMPWPVPVGHDGSCPACGWGIKEGDDDMYCLVCDSASPRVESRIRKARAGVKAKDRGDRARHKLEGRLRKLARTELSESDRRRIWNGYRHGIMEEADDVTNIAAEGRAFLIRENQVPDWSKVLVKRSWRDGQEV